MDHFTKDQQFKGVKGWWNSRNVEKWDKQYDDWDEHTVRSLNRRKEKLLGFVSELDLGRGAKVLELGYGAGQMAAELGKMGFDYYGLDISENLTEIASKRCRAECPNGSFSFKISNLDSVLPYSDNAFDLILISGVLHYLYDPQVTLRESNRVLKTKGHIVVGQRTAYSLSQLCSIRGIVGSLVYLLLREQYELFPSFKAMLCDSRLGVVFGTFKNSKWMNTKFMLKGHDEWKYVLKKNLFSVRRLKRITQNSGFDLVRVDGAYYCYSDDPKYFQFNLKVDDFLERLTRKRLAYSLCRLARITVLLGIKV